MIPAPRAATTDLDPHATPKRQGDEVAAAARAAGAALGNSGVSYTPPGQGALTSADPATLRRRERWDLRALLWDTSTLKSLRHCGKHLVHGADPEDGVPALRSHAGAGYGNLSACSSPWACPRCSAAIALERATEIARAIDAVHAGGGTVYMLTLTMRHDRTHTLADEWRALSKGWSAVFSGPVWAGSLGKPRADGTRARRIGERERYGILGTVRTVEATHGESGWHLHVHALLMCAGDPWPDDAALTAYGDRLFARWARGVTRAGMPAPLREHGTDLRRVDDGGADFLATYMTKNTPHHHSEDGHAAPTEHAMRAGLEASAGSLKKGRRSGRTPFQILRDCAAENAARPVRERYRWWVPRGWEHVQVDGAPALVCTDPDSADCGTVRPIDPRTGTAHALPSSDWALWHEWEQASRGRRQLLWSQRHDPDRKGRPLTEDEAAWNAVLDARGRDKTDEEIAAQTIDGDVAASIDYETWRRRMVRRPSLIYGLLEALEAAAVDDAPAVAEAWADSHGIDLLARAAPPQRGDRTGPR